MKPLLTLTFALLCLLPSGCAGRQPIAAANELVISSGTSFGMCLGYCITELRIEPDEARFTRSTREPELPSDTRVLPLSGDRWARIRANLDLAAFAALDEVYGCPDCADGGAEWIEVTTKGMSKRVTFEYGADVPRIRRLLEEVRGLRAQFEVEQ